MGKFTKILAVASVLCLGFVGAAKADTFTPGGASTATQDIFTGVAIFNLTTTTTIGGQTIVPSCPGAIPCNAIFGGSETATLNFFSGGGFTLVETAPPSSGSITNANQNTALTTKAGVCAAATSIFTTSASVFTVTAGTECTTAGTFVVAGNSQAGGAILKYFGNGVFSLTDDSFELAFQLPTTSTPEPSSLLMLGSGLLGLMGLGLRRKGIV